MLINKCVLNFRYIFSIGGEHFKVRAYRIYIYFYAEKFFCLIFRGQGQLAGGSYLRRSLYVLMIHFKKFGTFIRSVPISRLSNWTTDCARLSRVFYLNCRSRQILCLALRHRPSAILLNNLVSDFYIPLSTPLSCTSLIHQTELFFFSISSSVQDWSEVLKKVEVLKPQPSKDKVGIWSWI